MATADQTTALRERTGEQLRYYFDELLTPDTDGPNRSGLREKVHGDIRLLFDRCAREGITPRLLSADSGIQGLLLMQFIDNPQRRADAYAAEIYHLERELDMVRTARAASAVAEYRDALELTPQERARLRVRKFDIAQRWGVTRVTLDAWIASADERYRVEISRR